MKAFFIFCCSFVIAVTGYSDNKDLLFNLARQSYPPYILHTTPPGGIAVDVLTEIAGKLKLRLRFEKLPEKRSYRYLKEGRLDINLTALEWESEPEQFLFSEPFTTVREVIVLNKKNQWPVNSLQDLLGLSIGTPRGYSYPRLQSYFKTGRIERVNSSCEEAMLRMLSRGRVDAAIIAEETGYHLLRDRPVIREQLIFSDLVISSVELRFLFIRKWQSILPQFNRELSLLKKSGRLQRIIEQYR